MHKEDAVDKALKEAAADHSAFVQDLKQKLGKELRVWTSLLSLLWKQPAWQTHVFDNQECHSM